MEEVFFDILRLGLGANAIEPRVLTEDEWRSIFETASRHNLSGVSFLFAQKYAEALKDKGIPEDDIIPRNIYLSWLGSAVVISQHNEKMDECCKSVQSKFRDGGFNTCILKGRGVAEYYGELSPYRMSGDIDIWVWPQGDWNVSHKDRMKAVLRFLGSDVKSESPCYHHIEYKLPDGTVVEVHYTPSWMFSPIYNRRLQKWFAEQAPVEMQNEFSTLEFNRIYILLHIYRHLFFEGISLRQIVDYYFVLKYKELADDERRHYSKLLKSFGLYRFASALMWILQEKLGLEAEYLLCETNEREGQFLLTEILRAEASCKCIKGTSRIRGRSLFVTFFARVTRNSHFITHYPSEVLWCPIWKIWHLLWRHFKADS